MQINWTAETSSRHQSWKARFSHLNFPPCYTFIVSVRFQSPVGLLAWLRSHKRHFSESQRPTPTKKKRILFHFESKNQTMSITRWMVDCSCEFSIAKTAERPGFLPLPLPASPSGSFSTASSFKAFDAHGAFFFLHCISLNVWLQKWAINLIDCNSRAFEYATFCMHWKKPCGRARADERMTQTSGWFIRRQKP